MDLRSTIHRLGKALAILALIYLFLLSITLIGEIFKLLGKDFAESIMRGISNPFVGIMVGVLCTAIVQSSSLTTSLIVGMVAGNVLTIDLAIPIVMGANIGTTITNILVSIGHITHKEEFKRAFAAATLHDFFNLFSVILLFPLQYFFNLIGTLARLGASCFANIGGLKIINPIGKILEPPVQLIIKLLGSQYWIGIVLALVMLFFALTYLVKIIKSMVLERVEVLFDQYIFKSTWRALLFGMILTATVQSSSITTSLMIPLAAAGVLSLKKIYPYDLGANIGTTITAFLASLATANINAITIALSHAIFNILGTAVFLPLRRLPIFFATLLARLTSQSRLYAIAYLLIIFFIIPLVFIFFTR
jgi:sodium-dependent phosphate cotransporter